MIPLLLLMPPLFLSFATPNARRTKRRSFPVMMHVHASSPSLAIPNVCPQDYRTLIHSDDAVRIGGYIATLEALGIQFLAVRA